MQSEILNSPAHASPSPRGTLGQSETFCRDLSRDAAAGKFRRYLLRVDVHDQLVALLSKMDKPTVVLTGKPGVGKSSNVYALAQQLVTSTEMPEGLRRMRVLELEVATFLAGASAGELERRAVELCRDAAAAGRSVLLFIDEAHTLLEAKVGSMTLGDILKPSLARGEICCVAATTDAGYRSTFEADEAMARRFQRVDVPEPGEAETITLLTRSTPSLASRHGLLITADDVSRAVKMSRRYVKHRANPDKANDLLDEAMALQRVAFDRAPEARVEFLGRLHRQIAEANNAGDHEEEERLRAVTEALEGGSLPFDANYLGQVVNRWTGLPTEVLTGEASELATLSSRVRERVVGQDQCVQPLLDAALRGLTGTGRVRGPLASAFLFGKTGVGKTETARVIAEELLGNKDALFRLDGSEFVEAHSVARLIGAPPGYVGFDQGGDLTAFARDHQFGVILFDEFEKAHRNVHDLFLQILEEGQLQDGRGVRVDFSGHLVLFTSNIDAGSGSSATVGFDVGDRTQRDDRERLASHVRPEFVNRLDMVLHYRSLDQADVRRIVQRIATDFSARLQSDRRLTVVVEDELLDQVAAEAFNPAWGGREAQRVFDRRVTQEVATWIVNNPSVRSARLVVGADSEAAS